MDEVMEAARALCAWMMSLPAPDETYEWNPDYRRTDR